MLTCSVAVALPAPHTTLKAAQRFLPPLLHPSSSKSNLLSLKQCVHKLMTQQQQRLLSSLSSSSSLVVEQSSRRSLQHHHHQQQASSPWVWRSRGIRHYYCCCLLNLNHHINFHYINNSSILNIYHHHHQQHRFLHQSTSASSDKIGAEEGAAAHGSITPNRLCHDIVNDSRKQGGLPVTQELYGKLEENHNEADEEEDHIWAIGPTLLPTFNVAGYANESENVKKLVQLGVDLSEWETRYGMIPLLYKSNFEKTMQPIITFLKDTGVDGPGLGRILKVNPFLFNEDARNLEKRVEYLRVKRFSEDAILNMITRNPYWLSYSVPRIDRRLGFFQTYFGLTGDQVRKLANAGTSGPKLITYHLGRVKDVTFTIKEEMGFTSKEIVKLLLERPRIWKESPRSIRRIFDYLHNEEKFPHGVFLNNPMLFLTRERRLKERIGFLKKLGRAQFNPQQPNYISPEMFCTGDDSEFATEVAGVSVEQYNNYLKTL